MYDIYQQSALGVKKCKVNNHTYPLNKSFIRVIPQKGDYPYKGL